MEILIGLVAILAVVLLAAWWFDRVRNREGRSRFSEGAERRAHLRSDVREEMLQQVAENRSVKDKEPP
jgi:flagellar biogenesis protein FliO